MNDFDISVGKRIRGLREKLGYSREKLSELADISPKFLYEIECGRKGMSAFTLYNISKALGTGCDYILLGKNESKNSSYIEESLSSMTPEQAEHVEHIIKHINALLR